jgi:uncharacterized surface protein with fasciclin (FAS1) repeats
MKQLVTITALAIAGLSLAASAVPSADSCSSKSVAPTYGQKAGAKMNVVETALAAGKFNTLATALKSAELVDALQGKGPFTVFAPTDAAFAEIPEDQLAALLKPENRGTLSTILTYHVVPGRVAAADVVKLDNASALNGQRFPIVADDHGVTVAGARVVTTDIECSNGIIHVVDSVMMPATSDVVGTAVDAGKFNTLATALKAAGLVEALQGEGPFTVFAPTDAAFAALPGGTVESLLKPENKHKLAAILKYHVVKGRVYSDQLSNGGVETLGGPSVQVHLGEAGVLVNDSKVAMADIETTNGVIHVIDKVLLPE